MTTQGYLTRNERARATIEAVVRDILRSPPPESVRVTARDNHTGDPAFYVFVTMPAENDIPEVSEQQRVSKAMWAALEAIDDERFPYLHFGPREPDIDYEEEF